MVSLSSYMFRAMLRNVGVPRLSLTSPTLFAEIISLLNELLRDYPAEILMNVSPTDHIDNKP